MARPTTPSTRGVVIDRPERRGSVVAVLLLAAIVVAVAVGLSSVEPEVAEPLILGILALLAMVGVFTLFAGAVGILRFTSNRREPPGEAELAFDGAPEGLVIADRDGRVKRANPAYLALTGATGEADLRPVERAFSGDPDVSDAIYRLAQAARAGGALTEEFRLAAAPTGGPVWYRIRVRPLGDRSGSTIWTVADITRDRERQENAFLELQSAINYLDHAPAGFFSADPSGEIVYMNATLAGWLDYDLAEFGPGGLTLRDILPRDAGTLLSAAPGEPGAVRTDIIDVDLRRRNATILPVRLHHKVAYAADGQPGASHTIAINRGRGGDVSEDLRAAEVRFARFFNNSPLAIATTDRAGRLVRTNAAFLRLSKDILGSGPEAQGRSLTDLVAGRDRAAVTTMIGQAVASRADVEPVEVALEGLATRSARFLAAPVDAAEHEGEAAIVYVIDTTEQRALQEQFAQSQKMQAVGQLAGGVAHDFNNILGAIILAADFLIGSHKPGDPSFQDIMSIKNNANRAANLVRQLLAYSRRQTLRPEVLDLNDAVSEALNLLRRVIGERVTLDIAHGRDLWPVRVDVNQFEQVIMNLAVNARDAMPDGGRLAIRLSNLPEAEATRLARADLPPADYVHVEVEDSGTGIPPEILDKIFEPFFTTKEVGKGTGLGLSTVYGIVKQTGGTILVDSVLGRGTVFHIFLPRHVEQVAPAAEASLATVVPFARAGETGPSESSAPPPVAQPADVDLTGRGRILLVEDEEALRGLSARTLKTRGFEVIEAGSGVEALQMIDEYGDVDLVVSDVVMPEMDGPTLLRELRKRNPATRIIFVSGYAEEAFARNMPEGEEFAFLAKPFSMKQLVELVKATIA